MLKNNPIHFESPSVQSYLSILQSVINRMANNSAGCKTWCITLVSAIVVVIVQSNKVELIWAAMIPIVLLFFLDAYYLGLERNFRKSYNQFIKKLHMNEASIEDVYIVTPFKGSWDVVISTFKAAIAVQIAPFYLLLILTLLIANLKLF